MADWASTITVPEGFHYETKYIVLSYLGLPAASRAQASSTEAQGDDQARENERERNRVMKGQIEDELRQLEDHISASFSRTGFDCHTSPVFSPANPDSSIEDCLAALGDRVSRDLGEHLTTAVHTLLTGPLDYQSFRNAALHVSSHTQGGWNKVLVPLVMLQALQREGQVLSTLLPLGVDFLEEAEVDYITQQGGWGTVFSLEEEEEQGVIIAEDSNDIYILSADQHPDQLSPPSSLLCTGDDGSGHGSWQTESLPVSLAGHESWAQVGMMDPEDVKSLDSNEGAGGLAEERSDNNSSNSDIVHVEREEAEDGGEAGAAEGLQGSVISVLGTESELAELRREQSPTPPASLVSLEETPVSAAAPLASFEPEPETPVPVPAIEPDSETPVLVPAIKPDPELEAPVPVPAIEPDPVPVPAIEPDLKAPVPVPAIEPDPEPLLATAAAPVDAAPSSPAKEPPAERQPSPEPEPQPEVETVAEPEAAPLLAAPPLEAPVEEVPVEEAPVQTEPDTEPELPVLLYGGAALVALAAVVAYGALTYRRK